MSPTPVAESEVVFTGLATRAYMHKHLRPLTFRHPERQFQTILAVTPHSFAADPLFSKLESIIISYMESNNKPAHCPPEDHHSVSPEEARRSLAEVEDLGRVTSWQANPWALAAVFSLFAVVISLWVWNEFLWGMGVLAVMGPVWFLLRRHLFNPYTRLRPWQSLEQQENYAPKQRLLSASAVMWPMLAFVFPAEPRWIGAGVGFIAAVHLSSVVRKLENLL